MSMQTIRRPLVHPRDKDLRTDHLHLTLLATPQTDDEQEQHQTGSTLQDARREPWHTDPTGRYLHRPDKM